VSWKNAHACEGNPAEAAQQGRIIDGSSTPSREDTPAKRVAVLLFSLFAENWLEQSAKDERFIHIDN
jgi:hypothetical protein